MEFDSETSEQRTEFDDNLSEVNTTLILLEIRKDVKKMITKFDHLETSVNKLKRDRKFLTGQKCAPYETGQRIKIICIKIRIAK